MTKREVEAAARSWALESLKRDYSFYDPIRCREILDQPEGQGRINAFEAGYAAAMAEERKIDLAIDLAAASRLVAEYSGLFVAKEQSAGSDCAFAYAKLCGSLEGLLLLELARVGDTLQTIRGFIAAERKEDAA